jgi:hypothetical protein
MARFVLMKTEQTLGLQHAADDDDDEVTQESTLPNNCLEETECNLTKFGKPSLKLRDHRIG